MGFPSRWTRIGVTPESPLRGADEPSTLVIRLVRNLPPSEMYQQIALGVALGTIPSPDVLGYFDVLQDKEVEFRQVTKIIRILGNPGRYHPWRRSKEESRPRKVGEKPVGKAHIGTRTRRQRYLDDVWEKKRDLLLSRLVYERREKRRNEEIESSRFQRDRTYEKEKTTVTKETFSKIVRTPLERPPKIKSGRLKIKEKPSKSRSKFGDTAPALDMSNERPLRNQRVSIGESKFRLSCEDKLDTNVKLNGDDRLRTKSLSEAWLTRQGFDRLTLDSNDSLQDPTTALNRRREKATSRNDDWEAKRELQTAELVERPKREKSTERIGLQIMGKKPQKHDNVMSLERARREPRGCWKLKL